MYNNCTFFIHSFNKSFIETYTLLIAETIVHILLGRGSRYTYTQISFMQFEKYWNKTMQKVFSDHRARRDLTGEDGLTEKVAQKTCDLGFFWCPEWDNVCAWRTPGNTDEQSTFRAQWERLCALYSCWDGGGVREGQKSCWVWITWGLECCIQPLYSYSQVCTLESLGELCKILKPRPMKGTKLLPPQTVSFKTKDSERTFDTPPPPFLFQPKRIQIEKPASGGES